ncbi:MAG TPA: ABC transporter permease subunit, partial [Solirubrobacteraceae bacterium]|nr:ABC transporter permease subunit [Solirubrobacteraceae bacterium]
RDGSGVGADQIAGLGRSVFQTLLFFAVMLLCFIVPGQTAAAIAGERERQTLVPLQVTMLRSRSILMGKLLASLAFVGLLVVATTPLAAVAFALGGVETIEVVKALGMLLVIATALASIALLCSTLMRRTQGATVVTYGAVLMMTIGSFMAFGMQMSLSQGESVSDQKVLQLNPFMAVASVLDDPGDGQGGFSPFEPMQSLLRQRSEPQNPAFVAARQVGPDGEFRDFEAQREPRPSGLNQLPFSALALLGYAVVIVGSLALAAYVLQVPRAAP